MMLAAMVAAPIAQAAGGETIPQIGRSLQEKQKVVSYLQGRIAKHQKMTTAEIIADLTSTAEHNRQLIAAKNPEIAASAEKEIILTTDQLKALGDKNVIIAMETAQLQKVMSSDNYMLYMMNHVAPQMAYLACKCSDPIISGILGALFMLPIDIIIIPIEFILTAATGF